MNQILNPSPFTYNIARENAKPPQYELSFWSWSCDHEIMVMSSNYKVAVSESVTSRLGRGLPGQGRDCQPTEAGWRAARRVGRMGEASFVSHGIEYTSMA